MSTIITAISISILFIVCIIGIIHDIKSVIKQLKK